MTFSMLPVWMRVIGIILTVMSVLFILLIVATISFYVKINRPRNSENVKTPPRHSKPKKNPDGILPITLDSGAYVPIRAHRDDAGLDLFSAETGVIPPMTTVVFNTGVHMALPEKTCGLIVPKSGLGSKGIFCIGLIDLNFRGAVGAIMYNSTDKPFPIDKGMKLTQMVIIPYISPTPTIVESLDDTDRGSNGFGSTGK